MLQIFVHLILAFLLLILPFHSASAQSADVDLQRALDWLGSQIQEDGGFSNGFAPESDIGTTADAVFALAVAGRDPSNLLSSSAESPLDFLRVWVDSGQASGPGVAAKVAMAVNVAGFDPRTFAGRDLIAMVQDGYDPGTGLFGLGPFDSGLAILALSMMNSKVPAGSLEALIETRMEDGSFAFSTDPNLTTGDSNTTAIVVQALVAAGMENELSPSLEYFRTTQNEDGGWTFQKPSEFGEETDVNSTALVIQALRASGEELADWGDPSSILGSLQESSGAFAFSSSFPGDNILATIQAIPTLAGADYVQPFPVDMPQSNTNQAVLIGVLVILVLVLGTVAIANRGASKEQREDVAG